MGSVIGRLEESGLFSLEAGGCWSLKEVAGEEWRLKSHYGLLGTPA